MGLVVMTGSAFQKTWNSHLGLMQVPLPTWPNLFSCVFLFCLWDHEETEREKGKPERETANCIPK